MQTAALGREIALRDTFTATTVISDGADTLVMRGRAEETISQFGRVGALHRWERSRSTVSRQILGAFFNVHGNVWEWTEDCWNDSNRGNPGNGSARATGGCSRRVVRGGSWVGIPQYLRAADRSWYTAGVDRNSSIGFRLARTLNP
jgi:formylglycine-generating enzyme required for sulfatase activity